MELIKHSEYDGNIQKFSCNDFGQVRITKNDDGSISINVEDAASGLGWTQLKSGKEYVRWETINSYLKEFGFSQDVGKDDYIHESLFYLLAMKANNKAARDFQKWIAIDIIPQIRISGSYEAVDLSPELRAIFVIDKRTVEMDNRMKSLENNMTIDYSQQEELRSLVVRKIICALGGKDAPAYRELNKKAFSSIWRYYKRALNVNSYRNTSVKKYEFARNIIEQWEPDRELELMIKGANSLNELL